jgi:hypothetical protein
MLNTHVRVAAGPSAHAGHHWSTGRRPGGVDLGMQVGRLAGVGVHRRPPAGSHPNRSPGERLIAGTRWDGGRPRRARRRPGRRVGGLPRRGRGLLLRDGVEAGELSEFPSPRRCRPAPPPPRFGSTPGIAGRLDRDFAIQARAPAEAYLASRATPDLSSNPPDPGRTSPAKRSPTGSTSLPFTSPRPPG